MKVLSKTSGNGWPQECHRRFGGAALGIFIKLFVAITCAGLLTAGQVSAGRVRPAVWAGKFYPADPAELRKTISGLLDAARQDAVRLPAGRPVRAVVMPHAGYIYSGLTAAHALLAIDGRHFSRVVLLGPDHRVGLRGCAVSDAQAWQTPLGRVPVDEAARRLNERHRDFAPNATSDALEHCLEVELPFLQVQLGRFSIVPIVMGQADVEEVTRIVDGLLDEDTLLVVSSDLSHYLPYDQAVSRDRRTIDAVVSLNSGELAGCRNCACGRDPLRVLISLARRHGWQPRLLYANNSGDTAGDKDRVVGYAAIAFLGENAMTTKTDDSAVLNREQGLALVALARHTIAEKLGLKQAAEMPADLKATLKQEALQARRGTFVTLKINGQLRGCIGNIVAHDTIVDSVRQNAVNAAFRDPRFAPLSAAEFDDVDIEVSILTEPKPLSFTDARDLLSKLHANEDGVIIRRGGASATFLPQVWEQLPRPEAFLSHLCLKAGLPADAWERSGLEVLTYRVQYFEEEK